MYMLDTRGLNKVDVDTQVHTRKWLNYMFYSDGKILRKKKKAKKRYFIDIVVIVVKVIVVTNY